MPRLSVRTNEQDEENIARGMRKYPHLDKSEYIRMLAAQETYRQDGNSKDAKLDDILERIECLYRLVAMLLADRGMYPLEGTTPIPDADIVDARGRRQK